MKAKIFHGVNNALYFQHQGGTIIVDGIHQGHQDGFSMMPPTLVSALQQRTGLFHEIDSLLFTHLHTDHYDRGLLLHAMDTNPTPLVYGPGLDLSNTISEPVETGVYRIATGNGILYALDTVHEGEIYQNDLHQAYLLLLEGECFFLAGDATLTTADAAKLLNLAGSPITAAFLNVYQLWSPSGAEFLRVLRPKTLYLNHLPFREDDLGNLYGLSKQVIRHFPTDLPKPVLLEPLTWVDPV